VSAYTARTEKLGVPAVALGFADQVNFARNVALINGCPNIRFVDVPRTGSGEERVSKFMKNALQALIDPLTAKEKESGLYTPPEPPRIVFEGTMDDAQVFFQQTTPIENCRKCPIAKMTDGLPIIVPTEDKVKEMLTGTKHKPDEDIYRYTANATTPQPVKGTLVTFAQGYKATVEKIAAIAVMAGCKPEYLPVALAIATTGGGSTNCPGTSGSYGFVFVVSGPIAKEIGMNAGQNAFDVGNPVNMSLARAATLMTINLGGCITGQTRTDSGGPIRVCLAEDVDGLPTGWEGFNEEVGRPKTESVIGKVGTPMFWMGVGQYAPSSFRGLVGEGYGGMARRLGIEGKAGPKNFLEYVLPLSIPWNAQSGTTLIMHLNMAKSLYEFGFKKKSDVYKWMFDTYYITQGDWEKYGWYDFRTAAGENVESTSRKKYKDLPDDYKLHVFGTSNENSNCIIISASFADELTYQFPAGRPTGTPIDIWK
jgi:hypothetical protein